MKKATVVFILGVVICLVGFYYTLQRKPKITPGIGCAAVAMNAADNAFGLNEVEAVDDVNVNIIGDNNVVNVDRISGLFVADPFYYNPTGNGTTDDSALPILVTSDGYWLNQDGLKMTKSNSDEFFESHREYAKVAVAINSLYEIMQPSLAYCELIAVRDIASSMPHMPEEVDDYQWAADEIWSIYSNCPDDFEEILNDLYRQIDAQIDRDASDAAEAAAAIIQGKIMAFQEGGLFDEAKSQ